MLKFDFTTYMDKFINKDNYMDLINKKADIINKFNNSKMTKWFTNTLEENILENIKRIGLNIKENSDVLLVIGIGGSYMGSFSLINLFTNKFKKNKCEVIYIGNNLSGNCLSEVIDYIKDKDVSVNIISKSGSTFEVKVVYEIIKDLMIKKYSREELKNRIIITTNKNCGYLKEEIDKYGYLSFSMDDDIGGRYSIATVAHLLPMAVNGIDIDNFLSGYYDGKKYIDEAYKYAVNRKLMFDLGKYVENYSIYEPKLYYYTEFLKQLFAESEGKDNKGILPISTVNTRDLHSLGQFIQDGNKILFETVIKTDMNNDLNYYNDLSNYNDIVISSVIDAHYQGSVPNIIIDIGNLSEKTIGEVTMFFFLSAVFSAYLFNVNPFDQAGVEKYKDIMNKKLNFNDKEC